MAMRRVHTTPPNAHHDIYRQLWKLREEDGLRWSQIAERMGVSEPSLARFRKAAIADGYAIKEPSGRVTWLGPAGE